jgi:quinol monooxygenase YgiN
MIERYSDHATSEAHQSLDSFACFQAEKRERLLASSSYGGRRQKDSGNKI